MRVCVSPTLNLAKFCNFGRNRVWLSGFHHLSSLALVEGRLTLRAGVRSFHAGPPEVHVQTTLDEMNQPLLDYKRRMNPVDRTAQTIPPFIWFRLRAAGFLAFLLKQPDEQKPD
jgi:hypothetical protein